MNAFRLRHLEQALELYHKLPAATPSASTSPFPSLPLDLFVRHYFKCHKSINSADKLFITSHLYQIIKWKGLLDFLTPPPAAWSSRIRTYFISDRWKLHSTNQRLPPHLRCSFPEPLFARLEAALGTVKAIQVCNILNEDPPTFLRVNSNKITRERLYKFLVNKGVLVEKCANSPFGLVLPQRQKLGDLPEFKSGFFDIQDEASQLVAFKLQVEPGQKVLDYCAGSGGKTLAFGPLLGNTGRLYLHDTREHMLLEAKKRLKRAGIPNYQLLFPHATPDHVFKKLRGQMDWVLCDVPCTATGTLRRNPELKWKYSDDKLFDLVALQREIFASALIYMKPNKGRILYSTSSILDEENVHQVKFFCQQHGLVLSEAPFHALPQSKGMDGFFCAILEKRRC
ncbi:putative ribosomal RNA small subunit methyltransferase B [Toxoplasma gondii TgCatPRC2]|uniref:NOL1/NOP2/sun family domain-containing protein n=10 Tax=Toxoplasma gondii TaxID=5811 RepID=B6KTG1_TOXGV|nr:ribosomal RNA small subunit methyltransferase B, putative [Toxoplasma gondii ME49]ESS30823.1 putative ribosomal RNA small subunit methyltransferase B [Toxoplasma gondii VEG]KFG40239.1 putative ribosomal RNA small subunit methyltransferase B [Toxoplasma gondii GAB2-2007-GAL-DOM2]KFG44534.1 putative ribosomal RNA small subunit methyltransferase B [Toxoplasma gondii p89]KFG63186.1 putative ribosomal RNA small subunit methyltransferase B [Toxoplasma gondii RUB]KFH08526.1 putative ribosomal RNA |eukprot:XP_002371134.1 ribosomal RNA small subunit methyltransferase B, putative [Toxoplasma gondii ME49]